MRPLYTLALVLLSTTVLAQDYWCIQPGVQRYFTNRDGYLRGIRIDSVKTPGNTTVLYPFLSPRGNYKTEKLKPGGSWLGKTITILPDGTHLFDNYWGDTVIIKTQAALNESWILFNDATDTFYTATISNVDTMTVSGTIDSVKEITVTAKNSAGIIAGDLLNHMKILLSKGHGFVQVCDLFIFPMHEPGKIYTEGFDYWLDYITHHTASTNTLSDNILFRLIEFHNPDKLELYDYNPGDVFEYKLFDPKAPNGYIINQLILDEITSKNSLNPTQIQYSVNKWTYTQVYSSPPTHTTIPTIETFDITAGKLIDTSKMPEEAGQTYFYWYQPDDTSFCYTSRLYAMGSNFVYADGTVNTFEPCVPSQRYKAGFGIISDNICYEPAPNGQYSKDLVYARKNGTPCRLYIPLSIKETLPVPGISIYPNPASETLQIQSGYEGKYTITIYNMLGLLVKKIEASDKIITIPVTDVPAGLYEAIVTTDKGARTNGKLIIVH